MIQDHHRYIVSFGKLVIKLKEVEVEGTASFRRNYINIRVLVFAYMHFLQGVFFGQCIFGSTHLPVTSNSPELNLVK